MTKKVALTFKYYFNSQLPDKSVAFSSFGQPRETKTIFGTGLVFCDITHFFYCVINIVLEKWAKFYLKN